jgi:hypothetical protein
MVGNASARAIGSRGTSAGNVVRNLVPHALGAGDASDGQPNAHLTFLDVTAGPGAVGAPVRHGVLPVVGKPSPETEQEGQEADDGGVNPEPPPMSSTTVLGRSVRA